MGEEEYRVQMWESEQDDKTIVHATGAENAVEGPGTCMQLRSDEYGDADRVETSVTDKLDDLIASDEVVDEVGQGWALQSHDKNRRVTEGLSALFPLSAGLIDKKNSI